MLFIALYLSCLVFSCPQDGMRLTIGASLWQSYGINMQLIESPQG